MIKNKEGNRREFNYPVLSTGKEVVITNTEKADLMVNTFVAVHSSSNLTEGKQGRKKLKLEMWRR